MTTTYRTLWHHRSTDAYTDFTHDDPETAKARAEKYADQQRLQFERVTVFEVGGVMER